MGLGLNFDDFRREDLVGQLHRIKVTIWIYHPLSLRLIVIDRIWRVNLVAHSVVGLVDDDALILELLDSDINNILLVFFNHRAAPLSVRWAVAGGLQLYRFIARGRQLLVGKLVIAILL